jgi:hypothetical protein
MQARSGRFSAAWRAMTNIDDQGCAVVDKTDNLDSGRIVCRISNLACGLAA